MLVNFFKQANALQIEVVETEESKEQKRKYFKWQTNLCEESTKMGFPKKHLHRLVTHRPELIDAYADVKLVA